MNVPEISAVQPTTEEAALRKQMEAEFARESMYSGKAAHQLLQSLLQRNAIPKSRLQNFAEPFPRGRGKSHHDVFVRNGRQGEAIYKHPHFVP
jgi:hypothetical protein